MILYEQVTVLNINGSRKKKEIQNEYQSGETTLDSYQMKVMPYDMQTQKEISAYLKVPCRISFIGH